MTTTNRRPWVNLEPQPIVFAGPRKHRKPSFYEATTILEFIPDRQRSRSRSCDSCATPASPSDCFCGYCGNRLSVR